MEDRMARSTPTSITKSQSSVNQSISHIPDIWNRSITTDYWTISTGVAIRTGFSCRECKRVINLKEQVVVRDGRKMRFFFHTECYTGTADPRTQPNSSFHSLRYRDVIQKEAPNVKGKGKWSVSHYGYNDQAVWK